MGTRRSRIVLTESTDLIHLGQKACKFLNRLPGLPTGSREIQSSAVERLRRPCPSNSTKIAVDAWTAVP